MTTSKFDDPNEPQFGVVGICGSCTHQGENPFTCDAFPDGIPTEILIGEVDHTTPYKGDRGIQFSRKGPQG